MKVISVIVPCYNEEESLPLYYKAMKELEQRLEDAVFELLFVDDGSKDRTYPLLKELKSQDERVKYISFSRNFGKEAAIFSGLRAVTGDCCVVMDGDLQHPPETILEMYEKWREGFEVVEGMKLTRGKESLFHRGCASIFYGMLSRMIGMDMNNSSDFKLIDRKVVEVLADLTERDTFFRALTYWAGFKSTEVFYEVQDRQAGTSKWSFVSLFRYAIKNITSFSYSPLRLITWVGSIILGIGVIVGIDAVISFFLGKAMEGYPTLVFLMLVSTGGIMFSLGILGTYIAKIYEEIKHRPQYIIKDKQE